MHSPTSNSELAPTKHLLIRESIARLAQLGRAAVAFGLAIVAPGTIIGVASEIVEAEKHPVVAETGGYPWADAAHIPKPPATDIITWGYPDKTACDNKSPDYNCNSYAVGGNYVRDQWGFDLRNCTSYVAWRAAKEFGVSVPGSWGNADKWDDGARASGYAVDVNGPEPGDIAVWDSMHVAFVERVNADGSVRVSEYNQRLDGTFQSSRDVRADHYIDINGEGVIWGGSSASTASSTPSTGPLSYASIAEGTEFYSGENRVYTKVGGSAWHIEHMNTWTDADTQRWGNKPVGPVPTAEVHTYEAGWGPSGREFGAHPPGFPVAVYEDGNPQQWYFFMGHAFPIGAGEIDDLGVRDKALRIPAGRLDEFAYNHNGALVLPNGSVYRAAGGIAVRHQVQAANGARNSYTVGNDTLLDCLDLAQGHKVVILPQSAVPYAEEGVSVLNQSTSCTFPSGMVLRGPGGLEQWRIEGAGSNGYVRRYFPNALTAYLHTSGNPDHRVLRSISAINDIPQGPDMTLPEGVFMVIKESGQQFKYENGLFRPIPWPDMNTCLGNTNPVYVPSSIVGPVPQGPPMSCTYDNRIVVRPNGYAYYIEGGRKHSIANPAVRDCLIGRLGTGNWTYASDATIDGYVSSTPAYCPYRNEPGLYFIQEQGDPTVWFVEPNGVKRHVGSLCVGDPYTTRWKQFHVFTVPPGETAGYAKGADWFADGAKCDQLAKVWM